MGDARKKAGDIKDGALIGLDPAGEKKVKASGGPRKPKGKPVTITDAVELWMERHVNENNKRPEARRDLFDKYVLPYWADLNVSDLTRQHGIDLVEVLEGKHGTTTANRSVQAAKAMINWMLRKGQTTLEYNPLLLIEADGKEVPRDRVLTDDEVRKIFKDLHGRDTIYSDILQILFYTGQRRGEVAGMTKQEIDLDAKVWSLPKERTKNSKPHQVHLSAPVLEIIEKRMASTDSDILFSASGTEPFQAWGRSKERLDDRCKVTGWTIHDIRRTVVTDMGEKLSGKPFAQPHIVEATINHISGAAKAGVAGVYNRAVYKDERIKLLNAWAAYLDNVILAADDTVVSLTA